MTAASLRPGERLLVAAVAELGAASRTDLARATGLPGRTVGAMVARLVAGGVLAELPPRTGAPGGRPTGRPARVVALAAPAGLVAAVAVSRHELRVGAVGLDGTVRAGAVLPMETLGAADVVTPAVELLDAALAGAGLDRSALACAVVGVPGPFRRGVGVVPFRDVPAPIRRFFPGATPGWMRRDPAFEVTALLGVPAVADNDANLGALGEAVYGAAAGADIAIYVKYAQGLGAGVVVGGRPVRGATGHGGELTHVRVQEDGPVCGCGGRGCLALLTSPEHFLQALRRSYRDATAMDDVLALAEHGDPGVLRLLHDAGRLMGRPLADLCTVLNPHAVVLDARLGAAAAPVLAGIREAVDHYALAPAAEAVRIVPGTLGEDAELLGAAALARLEGLTTRRSPADPPTGR